MINIIVCLVTITVLGRVTSLTDKDMTDILKTGPLLIDCADVDTTFLFKDGLGRLVPIDMTTSGAALTAIYRLPQFVPVQEVKGGVYEQCRMLTAAYKSVNLRLLANWSAWSTCNPATCQQIRTRPCSDVSCPLSGQQDIQVCKKREQCLDSCFTLKEPYLHLGVLVISWSLNEDCEVRQSSISVKSKGITRRYTATENSNEIVFPYNSANNYSIKTDFRGVYHGQYARLRAIIDADDSHSLDWSRVRGILYSVYYDLLYTGNLHAQHTETVSCAKRREGLVCEYETFVTLQVNGLQEGNTRLVVEQYCNENRKINLNTTTQNGETVTQNIDLSTKPPHKCKDIPIADDDTDFGKDDEDETVEEDENSDKTILNKPKTDINKETMISGPVEQTASLDAQTREQTASLDAQTREQTASLDAQTREQTASLDAQTREQTASLDPQTTEELDDGNGRDESDPNDDVNKNYVSSSEDDPEDDVSNVKDIGGDKLYGMKGNPDYNFDVDNNARNQTGENVANDSNTDNVSNTKSDKDGEDVSKQGPSGNKTDVLDAEEIVEEEVASNEELGKSSSIAPFVSLVLIISVVVS